MNQTDRLPNGLRVLEPLYRYGEIRIRGRFVRNFLRNVISRKKNLLFRLHPESRVASAAPSQRRWCRFWKNLNSSPSQLPRKSYRK